MKTLNTIKTILLLIITIAISSCTNNDDDGTTMTCTTQGMIYDLGSNPRVFKPEASLTTDFNITLSNGTEVEIYGAGVVFVTTEVNLNDTGIAMLILDNGPNATIAVTCLATGTNV
ncbi:MAG: hypothetical protein QNK89_01135 [Lacinutrix sp.]|uniref:hypothetical protein n=1 Tax=Lacinutrix sp. TaxID=1937692 RepID=UPI0030A7AE92